MLRYIKTIGFLIIPITLAAQGPADALRYSQNINSGTARFVGMGGAFGALGSDFTSLSYNPAGLGVYRTSEFTFTPSFYSRNDESKYNGPLANSSRTRFGFDNLGFVASFQTAKPDESGLVSINLGLGYNKLADFHGESMAIGAAGYSTSIMNYFAEGAYGLDYWYDLTPDFTSNPEYNPYKELGTGAWESILAWNSFLIDTSTNYYSYKPMLLDGEGVNQNHTIATSGSMGEYVISLAANISHKFYIGATIGIQNVYYKQITNHSEIGFDDNEPISIGGRNYIVKSLNYKQTYEVNGSGYNFKLGGIYRPIPQLRIGVAAHTPTYFNLNEKYIANMQSSLSIDGVLGSENHSTPTNNLDYSIETPFKLIGSLAYTIGEIAILSADYELIDYTLMRLSWDYVGLDYDEYIREKNGDIKSSYRQSQNIKLGGEVWLGKVALRGGYALYGSPYVSTDLNAKSTITALSGGLGYRAGNMFIDFAYQRYSFKDFYYMYNIVDVNGVSTVPAVSRTNTQGKFFMTVGYKF
jgi:hypothetical protein